MMKQCTIHDLLNIIKKTSQSTKIPFNDLKHKIKVYRNTRKEISANQMTPVNKNVTVLAVDF